MQTPFDPTNRGKLFKNAKKTEGDKKPNYSGPLNVGGTEYRIAAWVQKNKTTGETELSLRIEEKLNQPAGASLSSQPAPALANDDIPF